MPELKKLVCLKIGPKEGAYAIREATNIYKKLKQEIDFDGLELRFNAVPDRVMGARGPPIKEMIQFVKQVRTDFGKDSVLYLHSSSYLVINLANGRLDEDFLDMFDKLVVHKGVYEDIVAYKTHREIEKYRKTKFASRKVWTYWIPMLMSEFDSEYHGTSMDSLLENEPYLDTNMHQTHKEALRRKCDKTFDVGHFMKSFYQPTERDPNIFSDHIGAYTKQTGSGIVLNMEYIKDLAANISHCHVHGFDKELFQDHIPFEQKTSAVNRELICKILANAKNLGSFTIELNPLFHNAMSVAKSMDYFQKTFCMR